MAKDYNSAKSNTSPSVKPGSSGGEASEGAADGPGDPIRDIVIGGKAPGGKDGGSDDLDSSDTNHDVGDYLKGVAPGATLLIDSAAAEESTGTNQDVGGSEKSGAIDHNSTRSNRGGSVGGGGGTTGLRTTLSLMKSAFTLATIIVLVAAGADVYKMYKDHVNINLEDHVTDADFRLTDDKNSIVGEIGFDIPKMGYFEKSIDVQIHLKILESDPTTEGDFDFEYTLGSGEQIYDKFELTNLDPVTKDKIDKEEPLDIEYTITITIIYLGVELGPTTSEIGTKVSTVDTSSES